MFELLGLIPLFPLLGFLILVFTEGKLPKNLVPMVGVGSIGLSAFLVALIGFEFFTDNPAPFQQTLWTWMSVGDFTPGFSFYLDALSLTMMFVITGVGFLIHLYSAGYMVDDSGYSRFFSYMNLFVSAMLVLVLADNLALLYLGWEGVGLCSYLLIGFWYDKPYNGYAAPQSFYRDSGRGYGNGFGTFPAFHRSRDFGYSIPIRACFRTMDGRVQHSCFSGNFAVKWCGWKIRATPFTNVVA